MITFKIETITPAKARKYLEGNAQNQRNIREGWVVALAEMMEKGEFNGEDGQAIKFAEDDTMIDGQHRMLAVELYGHPVKMGVIRGLKNDAFKTQDAGKGRTVENFYQIANQEHAKVASQVAKWLFNVEHGGSIITAKKKLVPGLQADWALSSHPDIPNVIGGVAKYLNEFQKIGLGTKAHLGFCYYQWQKIDPVYAFEVARFYGTGNGEVSKTINSAKHYLLKMGNETRGQHLAGNQRVLRVTTVLNAAWNADREGRKNLTEIGIARIVEPLFRAFDKSKNKWSDSKLLPIMLQAA